MEQKYAQALMDIIEGGAAPLDAVAAVAKALKARGREGLLPKVGRTFERIARGSVRRKQTNIVVAREADAAVARIASGAQDARVMIDDSLIGGWRIEKGDTLTDVSYKKHLLEIYNRATRA